LNVKAKTVFIIGAIGAAGIILTVLLFGGEKGGAKNVPVILAPETAALSAASALVESINDASASAVFENSEIWDDYNEPAGVKPTADSPLKEIISSVAAPRVVFPLNLNTATADELQNIKGIGPATAANIIDYRDSNGPFADADELINVKGIGEKKLAEIKLYVYIDNKNAGTDME
jgi:competence protein ComEA